MARTSSARKPTRPAPGRPPGGERDRVRADLIEAARQHFLSRDFKAVSLRQIAGSAGVNSAMVNYYFGGKQGLYLAMVDEIVEELESSLGEMDGGGEFTIADFSSGYTALLARHPWWPNFMIREVLFSDGEIREAVVGKFTATIAPRLAGLVQREISSGHYRRDLNPVLTVVSMMGMTIFPFLARPLLEQVFGLELDDAGVARLAEHNTALFLTGTEARQDTGAES